ncbi:UPF0287-domain-containing protein [Rhizodiscina lignyota]|uniref:COX assembly mitochondrial protein n=1 Tax=Rhizodiscina lignyota TaxID=1504668 RepID=A0A9P4M9R7_9PEZI|nr:UPF0287-domain-containing protein [Rhizodiscina lignyota]
MHPHLHTKDNKGCDEVMQALEECHARGFLYRCTGGCNNAKLAVNMCLRGERLERTRKNREEAKVKRAKAEAAWAKIDAES